MQVKHTQKEFVWILKKKLEEFHDLYVQSDALLLVDVFQNSRNMCLEIYELDPARFLTSPGLAWEAALKKTKVKLDLLTDITTLALLAMFPLPARTIPLPALIIPFPVNKLPNKLAPNVPSNILKNPPLCPLVSFSIVLVTPFNKVPESSKASIIFIISFLSSIIIQLFNYSIIFNN